MGIHGRWNHMHGVSQEPIGGDKSVLIAACPSRGTGPTGPKHPTREDRTHRARRRGVGAFRTSEYSVTERALEAVEIRYADFARAHVGFCSAQSDLLRRSL